MCSIASVCKQEVIHCGMAYRIKEGIIVQYNEWIENIGDIDRNVHQTLDGVFATK